LGNQIKNLKDIHLIKKEIDSYNHKIEEWKKSHKNPLEELDKFLKPIFSKFYLRVKTEPDNYDEIKFIPIESLSFNENKEAVKTAVQTQFLSSGTQQILSRTVPLFALKPKHTIILIDEPENSLYPNIQKEFIDFITQESWNEGEKTCQFFFATHSPTIASSFDPWEIVELQFNADGKVEQKQYYEGERHVDNYKIHPKYLRWDKILTQVFDIESEGDEERQKQLYELAKIQSKIDYNKKNGNKEKLDELLDAFKKLAEKLQWDINSTMP